MRDFDIQEYAYLEEKEETQPRREITPVVQTNETRRLALKWERHVDRFGFAKIPNALLSYGGILGLTIQEIGFLCLHLRHRYDHRKINAGYSKVYPSLTQMAKWRSTDSRPTYSRLRKSLVEKGFISITDREGTSDITEFDTLFACLCFIATEDERLQDKEKTWRDSGANWHVLREERRLKLIENFENWKNENLLLHKKENTLRK